MKFKDIFFHLPIHILKLDYNLLVDSIAVSLFTNRETAMLSRIEVCLSGCPGHAQVLGAARITKCIEQGVLSKFLYRASQVKVVIFQVQNLT